MYKETFVSPFGRPTEEEAYKVLDSIRSAHPGWEELEAYVEKRSDGYHAVRVHQKN